VGWLRRAFERGGRSADTRGEILGLALRRSLDQDLEAAEGLLAGLVRRDATEIDAYLALASLYRQRGEIGRAIRIHQNLLLGQDLSEAERVDALSGLAGDFARGGFLRRAIAAYEELLERRPRDAAALGALLRLLTDAHEFDRAFALAPRLARLEKSSRRKLEAGLRLERAEARHAEGHAAEARRDLKRAVRLDPDRLQAWIRLGDLEAERGRAKAALAAWSRIPRMDRRQAARVYPKLEATYASRAASADYDRFLRTLLEEEPRDATARLALARSLAGRGQVEEATAEIRRVLEQDPEHLEAHALRGRVLLDHDREPHKAFVELLDVLERQGLLRARERSE